ncbi:ABC transporter ATP-binding protein [Conexibacter woesei]|uniref:ABC transporter related protein n=1 Tax=Conexibacter woesei (strain DSM 14684 / CCUG 47730 / CIP 108061 / JCM 11494 / NBRC 100937 / ID131577) TaxID=469383 RepID=D3FB67_CONWI|nr:ABC transporter ATP-binding protein [Conexibacter woesei]ADB53259.1 ABC transporter related protein [Conexibacter woesei DSM 14684]
MIATGDHRVVLDGVAHRYRGRGADVQALAPLSLAIEPGEFVAIVGPSGCGKTTLLQLVAGFLTPTEGVVAVGEERVSAPSPERGVVFQQANLYPWMSVRANVELGPRLRRAGRAERRRLADRYLGLVGLSEFADAAPYELSGGMQQRCQIARVLANDPAIMLLDEPFGALDALTRDRLQDELHRIWLGSGKTALFITHSVEEAVYLGTRVLVMSPRPGRIVFDEPVPFATGERGAALRAAPEFVAFREHVAAQIGRG